MILKGEGVPLCPHEIRYADKLTIYMHINSERNADPIAEMTRIAQDILGLPARGFKETYRSAEPGELIFDSTRCRISLTWGGWDQAGGNSMHIHYGRLHAPNEKNTMLWQGEECRCWHELDYVLHFLDGRTPDEAAKLDVSHPTTDPFYKTEITQKFHRRQPDWIAEMHEIIWEQYGQRLFDLFDLRQLEMWQKYQEFLKEVYDIQGRDSDIKPPMDKVC
ncbi:MAG: hypothetical protein HGB14_04785 [Anaerolineaceae bacterium]|nr:hypothetical protein [Anaerolineaceae bacterium]